MKSMNQATGHDGSSRKPTLLFLQRGDSQKLNDFMLSHRKQHVKCLRQFFHVIVIQEDGDYQEMCERYEPDLTMIEMLGGVERATLRKLKVSNKSSHPEVPKIAFLNADAWCDSRSGFLSDIDLWGVQATFSICTTAAEHMPPLENSLYVWPNFVDPDLYKDYEQPKVIPFLLTGSSTALYPWRQSMNKLIAEHYPALICPHFGYTTRLGVGQFMWGESYARTINSSWFVPACGTVAKEVVRKHFEVPACRTGLITEESAALKAAGFSDMENCVFATTSDLLDKVDYLFKNPEKLKSLTQAGYNLVHSRHTMRSRDQVLQWLMSYKSVSPGQKIVQDGPFSSIRVVQESSRIVSAHLAGNGDHLLSLREGQSLLRAGKYEAAAKCFQRSDAYTDHLTEPKLGLALCCLYQGDAQAALERLKVLVRNSLVGYKAIEPDPVEWAYFLVSQLCVGDLGKARSWAGQFPQMRHPELERVKWVIATLSNAATHPVVQYETAVNPTIHILPPKSMQQWVADVCSILKASGQLRFAEAIDKAIPPE